MKLIGVTLLLILSIFQSLFIESVNAAIITPESFGALASDNNDDSDAIQNALNSLNPGDTLSLKSGTYDVQKTITRQFAKQIVVQGNGNSILQKKEPFTGQYLLTFKYSEVITVKGIEFKGISDSLKWGEEGLYLASSKNTLVENSIFRNFGDSALRITTASDDMRPGIQSSSARVRNNLFENITQVTTTQASKINGKPVIVPSTTNILFENNQFNNLRGGLKVSARAITSNATIKGNTFNNVCTSGISAIEISSYTNVIVDSNKIDGCSKIAISAYPNSEGGVSYIPWGGLCIVNNNITNSNYGIRVAPFRQSFIDPVTEFKFLTISNNQLNGISQVALPSKGVVWLVNYHPTAVFSNLRIENNVGTRLPIGASLLSFLEGNPLIPVDLPRGTGHIIQNNIIQNLGSSRHSVGKRTTRVAAVCPTYTARSLPIWRKR